MIDAEDARLGGCQQLIEKQATPLCTVIRA